MSKGFWDFSLEDSVNKSQLIQPINLETSVQASDYATFKSCIMNNTFLAKHFAICYLLYYISLNHSHL